MKLIIAGGRDFEPHDEDVRFLNTFLGRVTEIVTADEPGAARYGEDWARNRGIPAMVFPAEWGKWGRMAGPIRDREMSRYADAVVLFPGGSREAAMYVEAKLAGLEIHDRRVPAINP